MAWGVQAWDDNGRETLGPTRRTGRFVGTFTIAGGSAAGSRTVDLPAGEPFFIVLQNSAEFYDRARVTLSDSTFSWDLVGTGFTVRYGVR